MSLGRMSLIQTIICLVLLTGLVSSVDLDWLNEVNPDLENDFKEMTENEKQLKTTALKQKNLYAFHLRFQYFLIKTNKLMVDSSYYIPFSVDQTGLWFGKEDEYKQLVKESYNRLLFAIQLIRSRVDFLNQNQVLKDFYEQDLADASQLSFLLEKTNNRFKRHVEIIYGLKAAYETNDVNLDKTLDKIKHEIELQNEDYIHLMGTAVDKADQLRVNNRKKSLFKKEKRTPKSYIKWLYEIDSGFDASLQAFIDDKTGFLQDIVNRKSLEKYYSKLLLFLQNTRTQMTLMRTLFPFEVKEHEERTADSSSHDKVLTRNENEVDFKQLSNECYHRLKAANQWIQERLVIQKVLDVNIALNNYYDEDMRELEWLSSIIESATKKVEYYLQNVYDKEAAYKSEGSLRKKQDLIKSFETAMRKRFFLVDTKIAIVNLMKLINSVSEEKQEVSSNQEHHGEQDNDIPA